MRWLNIIGVLKVCARGCDSSISYMSSDICTIIGDNIDDNFYFHSSHWPKTIERENGREKIRI